MVYMEFEFDLNKQNLEKFDDWLETRPKLVTNVRFLRPEELEMFNE